MYRADGDGLWVTTTAADYMEPWANEESEDEEDFSMEPIDMYNDRMWSYLS